MADRERDARAAEGSGRTEVQETRDSSETVTSEQMGETADAGMSSELVGAHSTRTGSETGYPGRGTTQGSVGPVEGLGVSDADNVGQAAGGFGEVIETGGPPEQAPDTLTTDNEATPTGAILDATGPGSDSEMSSPYRTTFDRETIASEAGATAGTTTGDRTGRLSGADDEPSSGTPSDLGEVVMDASDRVQADEIP